MEILAQAVSDVLPAMPIDGVNIFARVLLGGLLLVAVYVIAQVVWAILYPVRWLYEQIDDRLFWGAIDRQVARQRGENADQTSQNSGSYRMGQRVGRILRRLPRAN